MNTEEERGGRRGEKAGEKQVKHGGGKTGEKQVKRGGGKAGEKSRKGEKAGKTIAVTAGIS